mgnify:CR=1 FL=1
MRLCRAAQWQATNPLRPAHCGALLPAPTELLTTLCGAPSSLLERSAGTGSRWPCHLAYPLRPALIRVSTRLLYLPLQDLKLLAHDEDSEDEEGVEGGPGSMGASAGNLAGLEAQPGASYTSLNRLYSGG